MALPAVLEPKRRNGRDTDDISRSKRKNSQRVEIHSRVDAMPTVAGKIATERDPLIPAGPLNSFRDIAPAVKAFPDVQSDRK